MPEDTVGAPFDDEFYLEEVDPVELAVCQALYPVLSGVFARELAEVIGE